MIALPLSLLAIPALALAASDDAARIDRAKRLLDAVELRFEPVDQPSPDGALYRGRFGDHPVAFRRNDASLTLGSATVRLRALGAATSPVVEGLGRHAAKSGYFFGKRESAWRANTPQFSSVRYREIYPGIDLVYRPAGKRLEYDFVVAPGSSPETIRVEFAGAASVRLDADGNLSVVAGGAELRQPKPFIYQDTPEGKRRVDGGYRLLGANSVAFEVASYDRTQPLVIDPIIVRASYFGGGNVDVARAAAFDGRGRLWVTGYTTSQDMPVGGEPFRDVRAGNKDVFVAVFNPLLNGPNALLYSSYFGGSGEEEGRAIAIDPAGTAHITGFTSSTDYPARVGYQDVNGGDRDVFVTQVNLDTRGDASLWYSTYFGGPKQDVGNAIAVSSDGRVFVVGYSDSVEFPLLGGPMQTSVRGGFDAFLIELQPGLQGRASGIYSTYLGGGSTDIGTGVAIGTNNRIYMSGYTMSGDFPIAGSSYQDVYKGQGDVFLTRVNRDRPGLDALDYSTYIGGADLDQAYALAIDATGRLYLAGVTFSSDFPLSPNAYQTKYSNEGDAFVLRFDTTLPRGQQLTYSTFAGGNRTDVAYGLVVDAQGRIVITGYTFSGDYPTNGDDIQRDLQGGFDAFISWFDPALPAAQGLACSTFVGGEATDAGFGVALDATGNPFVVGTTTSRDFGVPEGSLQQSLASFTDGFIARITTCARRP